MREEWGTRLPQVPPQDVAGRVGLGTCVSPTTGRVVF